jgi:hypothetical protein
MYNTNYECRYKDNNFDDNIKDEDKFLIQDYLYKNDFLNIFCINGKEKINILNSNILEYNIIERIIPELYIKLNNSHELKECMKLAAAKIISEDEELGLCLLFSYDYMFFTHKCICSYLNNGYILENDINTLKKLIN